MRAKTFDTAILLFSRSAAGESVAKPWVPNATKLNRSLSADLIRHARHLARLSGLPVVFISEHQQKGDSFGERFSNAIEQVFDKGFLKVIAIGNDCPALTEKDLTLAAENLSTRSMVIGPAKDGGAYLIGIHKSAFDPESFVRISWQTEGVLQELIAWSKGDPALLDVKSDLDSSIDLRKALQVIYLPIQLRDRIIALLNCSYIQLFLFTLALHKVAKPDNVSPRGPPRFQFQFIFS